MTVSLVIRPDEVQDSADLAAQIRHDIHSHPEVGLYLPETQKRILDALKEMGCQDVTVNVGGEKVSSVVAVIKGSRSGRTIGVRADMDALPLNERTGVSYSSCYEKRMHACGHDGHVATLLGLVHYLMGHRDFAGTVVAIFQPGEEGFAGARYMIEDGLVERFGIEEFYALHAEIGFPVGSVGFVSGFATANADIFEITFEGQGGHGARPHMAKDPVVAMGETILALQTIVSRNVEPDKACVVSIGCAQAGSPQGTSVIPQKAYLCGTTRCWLPDVRDLIEKRIVEIAQGVASIYGIKAHPVFTRLYPAMYNDPDRVAQAKELVKLALGDDHVGDFKRTAGGEDFSFMLNARPGCLFRLGMRDDTHNVGVHNEGFDFNDKAIATGIAAMLTVVLNRAAA